MSADLVQRLRLLERRLEERMMDEIFGYVWSLWIFPNVTG